MALCGLQETQTTRILLGSPEEYVHGRTLPIMLPRIIHAYSMPGVLMCIHSRTRACTALPDSVEHAGGIMINKARIGFFKKRAQSRRKEIPAQRAIARPVAAFEFEFRVLVQKAY